MRVPEFNLGDLVILDGDATLKFRVVGIQLYQHENMFLLSWFKPSGDHAEEWFGAWRLTLAE